MPKIIRTVRSTEAQRSSVAMIENASDAIASALGLSATHVMDHPNSSTDRYKHDIKLDGLGYAGWIVHLETVTNTSQSNKPTTASICIAKADSSGSYENDKFIIQEEWSNSSKLGDNCIDYNPATCVLFKDDANDSIGFSIHIGESATTMTNSGWSYVNASAFIGRDAKNEVMCGIGWGHVTQIRTATRSKNLGNRGIPQSTGLDDCLHLTKMVNYLSDSFSEMKNIYVALVRPSLSENYDINMSYYAGGYRYGVPAVHKQKYDEGFCNDMYPPAEPFIKY